MKFTRQVGLLIACVSQTALAHAQAVPPPNAPSAGQTERSPPTPGGTNTNTVAAQAEVAQAEAPATPIDSSSNDIVVTGSRVARDGSQAPTPVTAITSQALLTTAPSSLPDALNKLPQFTGSSSQFSAGTLNANAAPAGNYLNLRGLGSQRVLVLLNGQRVPPTNNTNAVDVNVIPQQLVQRVDVVTGGASAIYGSDAVSGVVNFVLDTGFTGIKLTAQAGLSDYGDAFSYRLGGAFGAKLGERLHILGSYEHYSNKGIDSLFDRSWSQYSPIAIGAGTAASPYQIVNNARRNNLSNGGVVLGTGPLAGFQFRPDGSLVRFNPGTPTASSLYNVGGDGGVWGDNPSIGATSIAGSLKTDQAFAHAAFEVTESIRVVGQGIYSSSTTGFNGVPANAAYGSAGGTRQITIYADNPFLRPEVAAQLTNAGQSSFSVGRIFTDVPPIKQRSNVEYFTGMAGLEADLGGSWKAGLHYVYGHADQDTVWDEFRSRNYFAAIDAVRDPATGAIVCGVTLRNPGLVPGCIPVNVLGAGNISREAFEFIREDSRYKIVNTMNYITADIRGELFNLPAGPVVFAGTAEYRRQTLDQTTNSDPTAFAGTAGAAFRAAYFNGIRGVPAAALLSTTINVGTGSGTQTIKEASGELLIPIFKEKPFAQALDLDLAARVTDYKTSGAVVSWKVGGTWTPVEGMRIRANQSRDIAAPSLYNLFAGTNFNLTTFADPLTRLSVVVPIATAGNSNLNPEFADTTTIGVVLKPTAIPRLTLSIDAYRIKIKGAIQTQSAADQLIDCDVSGGTASVCNLIDRPFAYSNNSAANIPTLIRVVPQNLADLSTQGVDFEVNYTAPLDDWLPAVGGSLNVRAFVNYLDSYKTQASANAPVLERAGYSDGASATGVITGLPRWRGLLSQTYVRPRFSFTATERLTGRYTVGAPNQVFNPVIVAPNRTYVDLNITYDFDQQGRVQTFINVQNVFNISPPIINLPLAVNLDIPTNKSFYDVVGRYFTAGVRVRF